MDVTITLPQILACFIASMGIPSALIGVIVKRLEKRLDEKEKKRAEKEENTEKLTLMILQNSRVTAVLAEATAKAVQRIPDANCNGDMTAALERAAEIQQVEQQFLFDQGIKHIFGD